MSRGKPSAAREDAIPHAERPLDEGQQQKAAMRRMFARIAHRYDLVNRLISLGQDQRLRRQALRMTRIPPTGRLLDVATGTGDVALMASQIYPEAHITGIDLTPEMIQPARSKTGRPSMGWGVGDGLRLPFPDRAFDAVISAFMMRNVPDVEQALAEQVRVVRPGGYVVCLEMSWPQRFPMSLLFKWYFFGWTPLIGRLISGEADAYTYLPRSVKAFRSPETMARHMLDVNLRDVVWKRMMFGTAVIYAGQK
ncbi:MAG: ubiquinone/menaquinone biosynthesis methyltransferase [Anaerolineae bacterium]|nr:ubiquinone/menaquinone biosynthesis methyltransferase [Anaerolineae bacterium]